MDPPSLISLEHQNIPRTFPLGFEIAVHRLHVEILTEIFLFCLPLRTPSESPRMFRTGPSVSRNEAPILLCHVCSSWRRIALQTPALWTCLFMAVSLEDTREVPERHSQAASYWFSHVRGHLVDLEISKQASTCNSWKFLKRYSPNFMMQVVRPHVEKIRSLHLSFINNYDICCLLQHQNDEGRLVEHAWSFPNLEYLTLKLDTFHVESAVVTAFRSMPKLHTFVLKVQIDTIRSNQLNIHLPWSQLTSLTIDDIDQSAFRTLITQCLALETGCFGISGSADEGLQTVGILTLTRLTTLKVQFYIESDPRVFNGIHLPALDDFLLLVLYPMDDLVWTVPQHMFHQLGSITTLSLGEQFTPLAIINLLRATTNVTTFKVQVEDELGEVFKALTLNGESENKEVLLPKLGVMYVRTSSYAYHCGIGPFAVVAFVEMVASRSPSGVEALGVAPLRDVCLCISANQNMLKADTDTVLEQWVHRRDMPRVRYEKCEWYEGRLEMWWTRRSVTNRPPTALAF